LSNVPTDVGRPSMWTVFGGWDVSTRSNNSLTVTDG
jgi:hypothetical protein